ncbi:uncharacterized protein LOC5515780 isoform X2 [Nematostella vectensis]|uniref:uncharacterized protein LOC5515780 isoform X2 n=1 Tax=Nematostella vectensis TaxID=45351 RepID=UPI0020775A4A|nr:uncharacterized protein LOC5515780 isoform X2 [Nematostella vectensis]
MLETAKLSLVLMLFQWHLATSNPNVLYRFVMDQGDEDNAKAFYADDNARWRSRDGNASNGRLGVLSIENPGYKAVHMEQPSCLTNLGSDSCEGGLGISFWLRYKGFISAILGDVTSYHTKLQGYLSNASPSGARWVKCYRAYEHGWSMSEFHRRCDFKGPTLTLVKVRDEAVFGGYSSASWGGPSGSRKGATGGEGAFVFSLLKKGQFSDYKHPITNGEVLFTDPVKGPKFGTLLDLGEHPENENHARGVIQLSGTEEFGLSDMEVFYMDSFLPLGMGDGRIPNSQIVPYADQVRMSDHGSGMDISQGSTVSITFPIPQKINGFAIRGSSAKYVSKLSIKYQDLRQSSTLMTYSENGEGKVYTLSDGDRRQFVFKSSIIATKVEFTAVEISSGVGSIALELYGRLLTEGGSCNKPLGMEAETILDGQITSKLPHKDEYSPQNARLNMKSGDENCWRGEKDRSDYIQIDLLDVYTITAIAVQACTDKNAYTKLYFLQYSIDGSSYEYYNDSSGSIKEFTGNTEDNNDIKKSELNPSIVARAIRIQPKVYKDRPSGRFELYGCPLEDDAPVFSTGDYAENKLGFAVTVTPNDTLKLAMTKIPSGVSSVMTTPFPVATWNRVTLAILDDSTTFISVNYTSVFQLAYKGSVESSVNKRVIFGNNFDSMRTENLQISDFLAWTKVTSMDQFKTLHYEYDGYNFNQAYSDTGNRRGTYVTLSNWVKMSSCVASPPRNLCSGSIGSGFLYLESSSPRQKGETAVIESNNRISVYQCFSFSYHMHGRNMGRLNLYVIDAAYGTKRLLWRLTGDQGAGWKKAYVSIDQTSAYKVRIEAVVGDGFSSDVAIDELRFDQTSCSTTPVIAVPGKLPSGFRKSSILSHHGNMNWLSSQINLEIGNRDRFWAPCFVKSLGHTLDVFSNNCTKKGPTVTLIRKGKYIFGGFTDRSWRNHGAPESSSTKSFIFSLVSPSTSTPQKFLLKANMTKAAISIIDGGPVFGGTPSFDLKIDVETSSVRVQIGNSYDPPVTQGGSSVASAAEFFVGASEFTADDIEVLYIGDHVCDQWCGIPGWDCDDVTGKCLCNFEDRNVEWCLEGKSQSSFSSYHHESEYYNDLNVLPSTQSGASIMPHGISQKAVNIEGSRAYVDLGSYKGSCIFDDSAAGLSVSVWLRYDNKTRQILFSIGQDPFEGSRLFLFLNNSSTDNLTVAARFLNKTNHYSFQVPWNLWAHLVISWSTSDQSLTVIVNGKPVDTLSYLVCFGCPPVISSYNIHLGSNEEQTTGVQFDEFAVYCKPLELASIDSMYIFYKGALGLRANYTLLFPDKTWSYYWTSLEYSGLLDLQNNLLRDIRGVFSGEDDAIRSVWIHECMNIETKVGCKVEVHFNLTGYIYVTTLNEAIDTGRLNAQLKLFEVNDVPSTPLTLTSTAHNGTSILVAWTHLLEDKLNGILQGYLVRYKEATQKDYSELNVLQYTTSHTIYNLTPYTMYDIGVSVINLEGIGIEAVIQARTGEEAPIAPPDSVVGQGLNQSAIKVFWKPPSGKLTGIYRRYQVCFMKMQVPPQVFTSADNRTIEAMPNQTDFNVTFGGLEANTKYVFIIRAFTVEYGPFSDVKSAMTVEGVPTGSPVNFTSHNGTAFDPKHNCFITWDPIPAHLLNGVLLTYRVMYRLLNAPVNETRVVELGVSCNSSLLIKGLDYFSVYEVRIAGASRGGGGVHSDPVYCYTEGIAPTGPVSNPKCLTPTKHSCAIQWGPVETSLQNGVMLGYNISYMAGGALKFVVVGDSSVLTKEINGLDVFTEYTFVIRAYNKFGLGNETQITCKSGEGAPPEIPTEVIDIGQTKGARSSDSCSISWKDVLSSTAGIIRGYLLLVRHTNVTDPAKQLLGTYALCAGTTQFTVPNLIPHNMYSLRLSVFTTEHGNFSEPLQCLTGEAVPQTAPERISGYNTSTFSINVTWSALKENVSGVLGGYTVFYRMRDAGINTTVNVSLPIPNTHVEIKDLEVNTSYIFEVAAFTGAGHGPRTAPIIVSTDSKVLPPPGEVPANVSEKNQTGSSRECSIQWSPVVSTDPDPDAAVIGYNIYYRVNDNNSEWQKQVLEGLNTTFDVTGLEEYTEYLIRVSAFNKYAEGNRSEELTCQTLQDAPSAPPQNLSGVPESSTAISITFGDIPERDQNGEVVYYLVCFYERALGNSTIQCLVVENTRSRREASFDQHSKTITGLKPYTEYVVQVLGHTIKDGVYSDPITVTTAEDVPALPPTNFIVFNTSETSLRLQWDPIPDGYLHGVLRGFNISYWLSDLPVNMTSINITPDQALTGPGKTGRRRRRSVDAPTYSWELTDLKIWSNYTVQINGYTIGEGVKTNMVNVTTDEGIPCLPPDYVTFDAPSQTSISVFWTPVLRHCQNGIILGYRLRYRILEPGSPVITLNFTADQNYTIVEDLDKKVNYTFSVSAFTRKGEGNASSDLIQPDQFGPKTSPLNVTAENWVTPNTVPVHWQPLDEPEIMEKLMGYRISYRPISIGDEVVRNRPWKNITVRKDKQTTFVIKDLINYVKYEFRVTGFTRGGDGPHEAANGETCHCYKRVAANYRIFPPYVIASLGLTSVNMSGMIPEILRNLTVSCCRTCRQHGQSYVDFFRNGQGGPSYHTNEKEVQNLIDNNNDLSFPVYGYQSQIVYEGIYRFIPLVESPGFALLVKEPDKINAFREIMLSVLGTWPCLLLTVLMALLAGIVMWMLDTTANPEHFPTTVVSGFWNGWWWAFISMTTLGYGDRVPLTNRARVFTIVWVLIGLVIFSILSGTITSAFTSIVFESATGIYGTKIATLSDTPEYRFAARRQARVNIDKNYTRFLDVVEALMSRSVEGVLIDAYEAGTKKKDLAGTGVRIQKVYDYKSTYGVVLSGPSVRLYKCSRNYMTAYKADMYTHIQKFVQVVEADAYDEVVELSTGLFDKDTQAFKDLLFYSLIVMGAFWFLGLLWELRRFLMNRKVEEGYEALEAKKKMESELREFANSFYEDLKETITSMRQRHKQERLQLLRQMPKSAKSTLARELKA